MLRHNDHVKLSILGNQGMPLNSQAEQLAQSPPDAIDCPILLGFLHCSSISVPGTVVVAKV